MGRPLAKDEANTKTVYILSSINKKIATLDRVVYILSSINKNISTRGRLSFCAPYCWK